MRRPDGLLLPARLQPLKGVLADRLQHPVAVLGPVACLPQIQHQAVVDQGSQAVQNADAQIPAGIRHGLCRVQGPAADEDRQAPEEGLLR